MEETCKDLSVATTVGNLLMQDGISDRWYLVSVVSNLTGWF